MAGCGKDPSFAIGRRNLITHAVDLMASTSTETYLSGARLLDALLGRVSFAPSVDAHVELRPRLCNIVAKTLLESASGTELIWKLLRTLDSRAQYDEMARARAASILVHLGGYIHLEQFPGAMQCIAPLPEAAMISPLVPNPKIVGLQILHSLAANSGNVRAITGTSSLVANITKLLDIHRHNMHDMSSVTAALASLVLIRRLVDRDFSLSGTPIIATDYSTFGAVTDATRRILICHLCDRSLQTEAMNTLRCLLLFGWSDLYGKFTIIDVLTKVFALGRNDYSRELAGEKLAMLSSELNAPIVFDQVKKFVASLKGILADDARDNDRVRVQDTSSTHPKESM